jgi:lipoprotein-releasing system permease protein
MATPPPFSRYEFFIAWRYLRARRAEGGVSVMTWISFLGIALAVAALIATLAVRSGFRYEFVGTILGANAHVSVYDQAEVDENGRVDRTLRITPRWPMPCACCPVSTHAAAVVRGQVMASNTGRNAGVEVIGIAPEDLARVPLVAEPEVARGDIARFSEGIAIGSGVARELGVAVGDSLRLISPDGARTPFGTSPRVSAYEVVYIFQVGRWDIDRVRVYMPFAEAQSYFNRDGVADEIEVMLDDPEDVGGMVAADPDGGGGGGVALDLAGQFGGVPAGAADGGQHHVRHPLDPRPDRHDEHRLGPHHAGEEQVARHRHPAHHGAERGGGPARLLHLRLGDRGGGDLAGVALGCAFAIWIDPIFDFVNWVAGGGVWDPSVRFLSSLPRGWNGVTCCRRCHCRWGCRSW